MAKREIGDLFEVFSDPRPSGGPANKGHKDVGDGFRKFLEERGEYPFKDEPGKLRLGRILRVRTETMLVVALAFLIANIVSFSLGVWNGKRGTVSAGEPLADGTPAVKLADVAAPSVISDPVPPAVRRPAPPPAPRAPVSAAAQPAPAAEEARYTIRAVSLGASQNKEAQEIAAHFQKMGHKPVVVRRCGDNLVVEVGAFSSTKNPDAVRSLRDVQNSKSGFTRFKDAFFVRK